MVGSVIVRRRFVVDYKEHPQGENHQRSNYLKSLVYSLHESNYYYYVTYQPTNFNKKSRLSTSHRFDVFAQPERSVEPGDGDYLEKRQIHYRYRSRVVINQLKEVYSTLKHFLYIKK